MREAPYEKIHCNGIILNPHKTEKSLEFYPATPALSRGKKPLKAATAAYRKLAAFFPQQTPAMQPMTLSTIYNAQSP